MAEDSLQVHLRSIFLVNGCAHLHLLRLGVQDTPDLPPIRAVNSLLGELLLPIYCPQIFLKNQGEKTLAELGEQFGIYSEPDPGLEEAVSRPGWIGVWQLQEHRAADEG